MSKPMSDGGKGSVRRNEDTEAYRNNYDAIFGKKNKKEKTPMMEFTEDGDVICPHCGTEMSATENGAYLHCDVCGHNEDFITEDDDCYD